MAACCGPCAETCGLYFSKVDLRFVLFSDQLVWGKMKSSPQVKVRYQRLPDGEEEKDIMIV